MPLLSLHGNNMRLSAGREIGPRYPADAVKISQPERCLVVSFQRCSAVVMLPAQTRSALVPGLRPCGSQSLAV